MSTIKADAVTAKSTNTDVVITGAGTGVPDIETGFKVSGTAGLDITNLRAGTDGELITWDASGDPAAVAVGTATHVLTSNGAGAAPTFQAAGGGKILQVISAFDDEYRTYSNTNYASPAEYTQLECTITPAATSSKIFLQVSLSCGVPYGQSGSSIAIIFKRDSTVIGSGDNTSRGSAEAEVHVANAMVSDWDANTHHLSGTFVDSPSSTSAIDYKVFIYAAHGTGTNKTAIANSGGYDYGNAEQQVGASQMVAMEIGA